MEEASASRSKKVDMLLWVSALLLAVAGIFANYYFGELAWALRFAGWIILVCVFIGLVAVTPQGKRIWVFAKGAKVELYKVVWPTRDEAIKITMVIAILVLVVSTILWGVDSILLRMVSWLMRQL